ncbi:MAG: hypothetical protein IPN13_06220 [Bacteroidetes bacterium]|nr:hypothetical protein [Bacteroidota bacterium]
MIFSGKCLQSIRRLMLQQAWRPRIFGTVMPISVTNNWPPQKNQSREKLPSTIDLITVGQAAHWFNLSKFFDAADNMLKPGGLLALFGIPYQQLTMS